MAPIAGIGLTVYARDVNPPPYWLVPIIIALLAVPGAGVLDAKWRDRLLRATEKRDA
jgi:hypothetical protein